MKYPPTTTTQAQELRAEDPSLPIAPPHQYSDDQRPMSKQEEALASAYLNAASLARQLLTDLPVIYFLSLLLTPDVILF